MLAAQGIQTPDAASDGDEPSGYAALADAAVSLWHLGADDDMRRLAEAIVSARATAALAQPLAYGALLRVAARLVGPPRQLVVVTRDRAAPLVAAARTMPVDVLAIVTPEQAADWSSAGFSLFADKTARDGVATAYDCREFVCRLPVTDPQALEA